MVPIDVGFSGSSGAGASISAPTTLSGGGGTSRRSVWIWVALIGALAAVAVAWWLYLRRH